MKRFLVVISFSAVALAACGGGGSGPSLGVQTQASAQSVAQSSSDFPGLQKCSESGSYESYLKAEETKNPDQYKTDKTTWEDLKAAGANDSYIAVYAANATDCGQFAAGTPPGEGPYLYPVPVKDFTTGFGRHKGAAEKLPPHDPHPPPPQA